MKTKRFLCCLIAFVVIGTCVFPAFAAETLVDPSTWAASDDLGRTLPDYYEVQKEDDGDRFVGMFYWSWHSEHARENKAVNLTEIMAEYPEAKNDFSHPAWKGNTGYHFWDEPIYGYYSTTDQYVIRKQAELLADAGVDVIFFDCTNGSFTWRSSYTQIFNTFEQAREEGVNTPQIAFMLNLSAQPTTKTMLRSLYNDIYKKGKWEDLWFQWKGKPLILAYPEALSGDEVDKEIASFFTFKPVEPSYGAPTDTQGRWGWLSLYPQTKYGPVGENGQVEEMSVSPAQNATISGILTAMNGERVRGRSYSDAKGYTGNAEDLFLGPNFQEQWDLVHEVDPEFVFVTGWNEWVAMRQKNFQGVENGFADEFSPEYSRDIEPSRGILKDYYYIQLCENIRRYKGVSKPAEDTNYEKTVDITGSADQWSDITPYHHYTNSTYARRSTGYGKVTYNGDPIRNDVVTAKVAYDDSNFYFYAETAEDLTSSEDPGWMRLFLDTDFENKGANWEGFEYVLNRVNPTENKCTLERAVAGAGDEEYKGWSWESVGEVDYTVSGNILQVSIPRSMLGMNRSDPVFHFKWSDNMQVDGDILDFYQYGEAAPGGRFTFVFDPLNVKGNTGVNVLSLILYIGIGVVAAAAIVVVIVLIKRKKKQKANA